MAGGDIRENEMTSVSSVDYVRGLKGKDSVLVAPNDVLEGGGFFRLEKNLEPGETYELPYVAGLIMVQNASYTLGKALAILFGTGSGNVITPNDSINFFSEVENKICVIKSGSSAKYVIKNTNNIAQIVAFTFIE